MKDHNRENLALQRRIGELEAEIVRKDDQVRELQHQLAAAREQIKDMVPPAITSPSQVKIWRCGICGRNHATMAAQMRCCVRNYA